MENSLVGGVHLTHLFVSIILFCLPHESKQGPHEKRLLNKLLNDYNVLERPVANESEPLLLSFGLTLQQIIDVVKTIFLIWLPWILRMERPGRKITRKQLFMSTKMKELELKERSSRSLLANVLDIDDDFRQPNSTGGYIHMPGGEDASTLHTCIRAQRELSCILKELRYITTRMRNEDEINDVIAEWKFAAMVVDRVCLILFSGFTIISTCVCLFSAPHLIA